MAVAKTNAMRLLDTMHIPYTPHSYSADGGAKDGVSVARELGLAPGRVFKTLVAQGASGGIFVFCLPADEELHLKNAAKAAGEKSIAMLPLARLRATTGYERGGCSPLAMKKAYPTFLHESAFLWGTILVSAGRVGLQMELAPADLQRAADAAPFG